MSKYEAQIESAKRLIAAKGELVIWRKIPVEETDKPWRKLGKTPVDYDVHIVFLPRDRGETQLIRSGGNGVQIGDVFGLMGAVPFETSPRDVVIRNGKECRIFAIDILAPDGEPILHTIDFDL